MRLTFLWVGRTRDRELGRAIERYLKRLERHAEVHVAVAPEVGDTRRYSLEHRLEREARGVLAKIPARGRTLVLDSRGEQRTSEEFAALVDAELTCGGGQLHFVLGGPAGLAPSVAERADRLVALGRMTLPHELARLVLVEQVYRAFSILGGGPYHR